MSDCNTISTVASTCRTRCVLLYIWAPCPVSYQFITVAFIPSIASCIWYKARHQSWEWGCKANQSLTCIPSQKTWKSSGEDFRLRLRNHVEFAQWADLYLKVLVPSLLPISFSIILSLLHLNFKTKTLSILHAASNSQLEFELVCRSRRCFWLQPNSTQKRTRDKKTFANRIANHSRVQGPFRLC